ncbi:MAG TPA: hypothetical protein VM510_16060, partial [Caulifigura sp.]|nr:hypothetical protein [Caulifigura sp.]
MTTELDALADARRRVAAVYSAETFSQLADVWRDVLTQHLASVTHSRERVLNWNDPPVNISAAGDLLDAGQRNDGFELPRMSERFRDQ